MPNEVGEGFIQRALSTLTNPTLVGVFKFPQGNASAPSIAVKTDVQSGFYQRTSGTINIGIGGNSIFEVAAGVVTIGNGANLGVGGKATSYNGITTQGYGVPVICAYGRVTAQAAAVASIATFTVGAADGSFEVGGNVLVTTRTSYSFNLAYTYTDETSGAHTLGLLYADSSKAIASVMANTDPNGFYNIFPVQIRAKAGTTITILTTGTFTTVAYNAEGVIKQLA